MASGTRQRGTIAVPQERDRPGQGLVRVRRVLATRSCRSTSSRWACSTAWRCSPTSRGRTRSCRSSSRRSRSRSSRSPTPDSSRRCRAPAATTSGRAASSTGSPAILTGAIVGGDRLLPRVQRPRARRDAIALVAGVVGVVVGGIIGRLNGGIGFVLAATGWWFILAMWAPIYGAILNIEFFQPLAALVKSSDGLTFFASQNGILFVSIVTIILTSRAGRARHGRLRTDPEVVPVPRSDRLRRSWSC